MQIFGLEPVVAALIIAAVGVTYSIGLGIVKSPDKPDVKKIITSVLIAIPGSLILVATGIGNSVATSDLTVLVLIVGWILQISGTDSTIKSIAGAIKRR